MYSLGVPIMFPFSIRVFSSHPTPIVFIALTQPLPIHQPVRMRLVHQSRLSLIPLVLAELTTPPTLPRRPATELAVAFTILHLSKFLRRNSKTQEKSFPAFLISSFNPSAHRRPR
jgi:hypothetical protein